MNVSEFLIKISLDGAQAANDLDAFTKSVEDLPDKASRAAKKTGENLKKAAGDAGDAAKDAAKKTQDAQKTMTRFGDKGVEAFSRIRSSAIRFFMAYASFSFAKNLIGGVMNANVAIGTLAKTSGESIKAIDGLQRTFKALNVSEQEAAQGISAWRQSLSNWSISGKLDPMLRQVRMLGVAASENGKEREFGDVLFDVGRKQLERAGGDKALAVRNMIAMGGFTPEQARAAIYGSKALYEEKKRNSVLTEEQIRQSEKLKRGLNEIKERWESIQKVLAGLLLPVVTEVTKEIEKLFGKMTGGGEKSEDKLKDLKFAVEGVVTVFRTAVDVAKTLYGWLKITADTVGQAFSRLDELFDKHKWQNNPGVKPDDGSGTDFFDDWRRINGGEKNELAILEDRERMGTLQDDDKARLAELRKKAAFTGKVPENIKGVITSAAKEVGFDENIMLKVAKAESNFKPNAGAGSSSAKGLFQFTDATWKGMVKKYGKRYGLSYGGVFDARQNSIAGALFMRDNAKKLSAAGLPVTPENIYMMHFMGETGGVNFLKKMRVAGDAAGFSYTKKMRDVGVANPTIFFKGFRNKIGFEEAQELAKRYFRGENVGITPRTMREVYALMSKKVGASFNPAPYKNAGQTINKKNVTYNIENVNLPSVKDSKDFTRAAENAFGMGAKTTSAFI